MNKIKLPILAVAFIAILFLTGCWDNNDVSDVAIVTAIGIDKLEDGRLAMTWQILKPEAAQPGMEGGQAGKAYTNYTAAGLTLNEAHKELIRISGRKPFYGHIQIILLGEKLAKDGIAEFIDIFERQYEFNQTVKVLLTKDMTAQELLEAESDLENLPAIHLMNLVEANIFTGKVIDLPFFKLVMELEREGRSTVISALSSKSKNDKSTIKEMQIEYAGIFRKGKLIGYINTVQVQSLLFIANQIRQTLITTEHPLSPDKQISVEIVRGQAKREVSLSEGRIKGIVYVDALARIAEVHETQYSLKPDIAKIIESETAGRIKQNLVTLIDMAQDNYGTDIFGFGELVYKNEYGFWKSVKDDWDEYFVHMPIDVFVDVKIKRAGLIDKPSKAR